MNPPDLLVLAPLRSEIEQALKALPGKGTPVPAPKPAHLLRFDVGGRAVVVGWTGLGRQATESALRFFADAPPRALVHLGVAGALRAGLAAGDAFLIERVHCDGEEALALSPQMQLVERRGECVTVDKALGTPAGKRSLGQRFPSAALVEMETYWAAKIAQELGIPATFLRVVCDEVDQRLPDLASALDRVGRPRPFAFIKKVATSPRTLAALPGIASAFGKAQRRLRELVRASVG